MTSHHELEPEWKAPPLACDSHFHVFGRRTLSLWDRSSLQTPGGAARRFSRALAKTRIRAVGVRPAERLRPRQRMHARSHARATRSRGSSTSTKMPLTPSSRRSTPWGCAASASTFAGHAAEPGFSAKLLRASSARCAVRRNRLDPGFPHAGWLTEELMGTLRRLKSNFMLAHMGMFLARDGVDQRGFKCCSTCSATVRGAAG